MYKSKIDVHFEDEESSSSSIEYYLINLPESLKEPKTLLNAIVQSGNHDYFELLPIQTIIKFKWEMYAKDFFLK